MNFNELLTKRRSIRKYKEQSVDVELLSNLIKDSTLAPSAGNLQPWKFIIINQKKLLNEISDECKENLLMRIDNNPTDFASRYRHMLENPNFNIFYNAPSMIIILGDSKIKNYKVDCSLAASYLMLSAASRNLGTCWINFALSMSDSTKDKIGIPYGYNIVAPLVVGYPAVKPEIPSRKSPEINIVDKINIIE